MNSLLAHSASFLRKKGGSCDVLVRITFHHWLNEFSLKPLDRDSGSEISEVERTPITRDSVLRHSDRKLAHYTTTPLHRPHWIAGAGLSASNCLRRYAATPFEDRLKSESWLVVLRFSGDEVMWTNACCYWDRLWPCSDEIGDILTSRRIPAFDYGHGKTS